jgi:hypothetical protein
MLASYTRTHQILVSLCQLVVRFPSDWVARFQRRGSLFRSSTPEIIRIVIHSSPAISTVRERRNNLEGWGFAKLLQYGPRDVSPVKRGARDLLHFVRPIWIDRALCAARRHRCCSTADALRIGSCNSKLCPRNAPSMSAFHPLHIRPMSAFDPKRTLRGCTHQVVNVLSLSPSDSGE